MTSLCCNRTTGQEVKYWVYATREDDSERKWWSSFDQKIGNYLEDFDAERPLQKEYARGRPFVRLLVILAMIIAFGIGAWLIYQDASNIRIQRFYLDKHEDYATQRLFNKSVSYGTLVDAEKKTRNSTSSDAPEFIDCPCRNKTFSWTAYTHFYTLNYTPPGDTPALNYILDNTTGSITALSDNRGTVDSKYLFVNQSNQLTRDEFCAFAISILPKEYTISSAYLDCPGLVASFFTTDPLPETPGNSRSRWNNPQASNFDSPLLLSQEFLYSKTLQNLYAYIQAQYSRLESMRPFTFDNKTYRDMYLTGISEIWLNVLDTFTRNSSASDLDFYMYASGTTIAMFYDRNVAYPEGEQYWEVLLYEGQTFLGMDINWMDYYKACNPSYCDVTKSNPWFRRLYIALAQIGGLITVVGMLVKLVIFPAVLFMLTRMFCCSRGTSRKG
ncbi:hypothetical protein M758_4G143900 [Ceratodon purpureus]|nr:hypothetical protein M758_4G143900 [Ceratodon purpureus]